MLQAHPFVRRNRFDKKYGPIILLQPLKGRAQTDLDHPTIIFSVTFGDQGGMTMPLGHLKNHENHET
jgi:hypothetical protein